MLPLEQDQKRPIFRGSTVFCNWLNAIQVFHSYNILANLRFCKIILAVAGVFIYSFSFPYLIRSSVFYIFIICVALMNYMLCTYGFFYISCDEFNLHARTTLMKKKKDYEPSYHIATVGFIIILF